MTDYSYKTGDTAPPITGEPDYDVTDAEVQFILSDGSERVASSYGTVEDGVLTYYPTSRDTGEPGFYKGEFKVTLQDGRTLSYPSDTYIYVKIYKSL